MVEINAPSPWPSTPASPLSDCSTSRETSVRLPKRVNCKTKMATSQRRIDEKHLQTANPGCVASASSGDKMSENHPAGISDQALAALDFRTRRRRDAYAAGHALTPPQCKTFEMSQCKKLGTKEHMYTYHIHTMFKYGAHARIYYNVV